MTGYLPVEFEFAAVITYPVFKGISSEMHNASAQVNCDFVVFWKVETVNTKYKKKNVLPICIVVIYSCVFTIKTLA